MLQKIMRALTILVIVSMLIPAGTVFAQASAATISGKITNVTDPTEVTVTVTLASDGSVIGTPVHPIADGTFSAQEGLDVGIEYVVTPSAAAYTFDSKSVTIAEGANDLGDFPGTLKTFEITGQVFSATEPVTVTFVDGDDATTDPSAQTDAVTGVYTITGVPYGATGAVVPSLAGYIFNSPTYPVETPVSDDITDVSFTAIKVWTISGHVTEGDTANGVPGVTVTFGAFSGVTDASGAYAITEVPDGTAAGDIVPTKVGWTIVPDKMAIGAVTDNVIQDFTATAITFTVSGAVTLDDEAKTPVEGVTVSLGTDSGTTIADGTYSFPVLYGATGDLQASKPGYSFLPAAVTFGETNPVLANVEQNFTASILTYTVSGKVTDSTGAAMEGVAVRLDDGQPIQTDAQGVYTFSLVPYGNHTIEAGKIGFNFNPPSYTELISENRAGDTGLDFVATAKATVKLSGAVIISGKPVMGIEISAGPGIPTVFTDKLGKYTLNVFKGDSVTPTAIDPSGYFVFKNDKTFKPTANVVRNWTTATVTVTGKITEIIPGSPETPVLTNVVVKAGTKVVTVTSADGSFSMVVTPANVANLASFKLTAAKTNFTFAPVSVTASNRAAIELYGTHKAFTVTGKVTTLVGKTVKPVAGVVVTFGSVTAKTNSMGIYTLKLPWGTKVDQPEAAKYGFAIAYTGAKPLVMPKANVSGKNFTATNIRDANAFITGRLGVYGSMSSITGHVVNLYLGQDLVATVKTDAYGFYKFANLVPVAGYNVVPGPSNYVFDPAAYENVSLVDTTGEQPVAKSFENGNFTGIWTAVIKGKIFGLPASKTEISVRVITADQPAGPNITIQVNPDGTYSYGDHPGEVVPMDSYIFIPEETNLLFQPRHQAVTIMPGMKVVTLNWLVLDVTPPPPPPPAQ